MPATTQYALRQVEPRVHAERHDRRRRTRGADAGDDAQDAVVVHPQVAIALRERDHAIELLALDPVLELAGPVAGVGAQLEHRDDHDLHRDGLRLRRRHAREHENREDEGENGRRPQHIAISTSSSSGR